MGKDEIINIFKSKGIIGPSGRRKSCWKKYWDDECKTIFNEYSLRYRSVEEAWFCLIHNIEPQLCAICGGLSRFTGCVRKKNNYFGYNTVCGSCSANDVDAKKIRHKNTVSQKTPEEKRSIEMKRRKTMEKRYGDSMLNLFGSESHKNRMIELYGAPYYSNKQKYKETMMERYGVDHNFKLPDHVEKSIKTKREKYGNASNYEKTKKTNLERYGKEHIGQVKSAQIKSTMKKRQTILDIEKKYNCTQDIKLRNIYGNSWKLLGLEKIKIGPYVFISNEDIPLIEQYIDEGSHTNKYTSIKEKELVDFIKSIYDGVILENITNIVISKNRFYELDIYLPDLNLAFDFNGIYWHSSKFKDPYYHQRKMLKCYDAGVQLIHIYENYWDKEKDIIKNQIIDVIKDKNNGIKYGWIPSDKLNEYYLTLPNIIEGIDNKYIIYDEGKFIKK